MGDYAGELPRKFISFHCLESESNELKDINTEGTENFPDPPQRTDTDVECGGGGSECPEKRIVDLQVMPVGEVHMESPKRINVPNLTNVVESVEGDSQIIVSHLLGEILEVLDDSRLRQMIENAPVDFGNVLEGERSTGDVRGITTGQFTENVTFLDNAVDSGSVNRTSTPSKDTVRVSGKRKSFGCEVELGSVFHPNIVVFEIRDGSGEESVALPSENGRVNAGKAFLSIDYPEKTLTEFRSLDLKVMARAKAGEFGPGSHVVSSDGSVSVSTVGSSGGPPDVGAVRTTY